MESFSGDVEESTEDNPGRRKSKLKSLKTRLFRRSKRADAEANTNLSQSASDITAGKGLGSDEDLCSQGMMGSRAFSHDSIFLADEVLADTEPVRVLSQENVNSKIKALQMKLQQQKMHLGPPPLVLPIRRQKDPGSHSEEGDFPHSPCEISVGDTTQGAHSKLFSHPLSPIHKSVPVMSSNILPLSSTESPLDFSSPAQFTPRLDTSAARHRMSVKPRNQRASTKKRTATSVSRSHLDTLNNINQPECVEDEQQRLSDSEEALLEEEQGADTSMTSQSLTSKLPQLESLTSEAVPISPGQTLSQQDHVVSSITSQVAGVKPHRRGDVMSTEQPHSSFIQSDVKERKEGPGDFEIQVKSNDKINTLVKAGTADLNFGSSGASRSSSVHQQGETHNITRGINRATPGSGSFHFSITPAKSRHGERPRSGSFVGVLERTGQKISGGAEDTVQGEKDKYKDSPYRGGPISGRFRQEHKSPFFPWDKQGSRKKVEPLIGPLEGQDVKSIGRDVVEEAVEAKEEVLEEDGKNMFGLKLRPTSQSMKIRSDEPSKHYSKALVGEEQCDKPKTQEIREVISKNLPTAISCIPSTSTDIKLTDPAPSGFTLPGKRKPPYSCDPHTMPTEVQTTLFNHKEVETTPIVSQESQSTPQTTTPEVSWMSLAMEKTRSIQQLITSRFPRDFTGGQAAVRPQGPPANLSETLNGAQTQQTQTFKLQQSNNKVTTWTTVQVETSPSHSVRSSDMTTTMQQKASTMFPVPLNTSQEPEKQINEQKSYANTIQVVSPTVSQTSLRTTQSPTYVSQSETASLFGQACVTPSLAQTCFSSGQHPWSNPGVHPTNKLKTSTWTAVSTSPAATASSPLFAMGKGEGAAAVEEKESPSHLGKRAVWAGSVSEKAAFLEKRPDWVTPPGTKGVELKKGPLETQSSGSFKRQTQSKDTKPEGRPGLKLESSLNKFPEGVCEDKWVRKNGESSSSLTLSQSDSDQPSWMELAKRKSMAWSDKNMD